MSHRACEALRHALAEERAALYHSPDSGDVGAPVHDNEWFYDPYPSMLRFDYCPYCGEAFPPDLYRNWVTRSWRRLVVGLGFGFAPRHRRRRAVGRREMPCCEVLDRQLTLSREGCHMHQGFLACLDTTVAQRGDIYFLSYAAGSAWVIHFCPWCGNQLTDDGVDRDNPPIRTEEYGLDRLRSQFIEFSPWLFEDEDDEEDEDSDDAR